MDSVSGADRIQDYIDVFMRYPSGSEADDFKSDGSSLTEIKNIPSGIRFGVLFDAKYKDEKYEKQMQLADVLYI